MAYGKIYRIARSHALVLNIQAGRKKRKEVKAAKTIAVVVGVFVFCWVPFFVFNILLSYHKFEKFDTRYLNMVKWLTYINAFLDPLVYTLFDRRFRSVLSGNIMNCFGECFHHQANESISERSGALPVRSTSITRYTNTRKMCSIEQSDIAECWKYFCEVILTSVYSRLCRREMRPLNSKNSDSCKLFWSQYGGLDVGQFAGHPSPLRDKTRDLLQTIQPKFRIFDRFRFYP